MNRVTDIPVSSIPGIRTLQLTKNKTVLHSIHSSKKSPVQEGLLNVHAIDVVKLPVHTLAATFKISRHQLIEAKLGPMILASSVIPRALQFYLEWWT